MLASSLRSPLALQNSFGDEFRAKQWEKTEHCYRTIDESPGSSSAPSKRHSLNSKFTPLTWKVGGGKRGEGEFSGTLGTTFGSVSWTLVADPSSRIPGLIDDLIAIFPHAPLGQHGPAKNVSGNSSMSICRAKVHAEGTESSIPDEANNNGCK